MNGCYWPRSPACCHSGCLPATKVCAHPAHILKTRPQTHHTTPHHTTLYHTIPTPTPTTTTNLPTYLRTSWKRASSNEKDTKNINPSKKWSIFIREPFQRKKTFLLGIAQIGGANPADLIWCKNVTSPTRGSKWPPLVQKRKITNRKIQLTSYGANTLRLQQGDPIDLSDV